MVSRKQIHAEIDHVDEARLDELYQVVKSFAKPKANGKKPTLMARLQKIKIEGPEDFSRNFDLYMSGEKRVEDNLR